MPPATLPLSAPDMAFDAGPTPPAGVPMLAGGEVCTAARSFEGGIDGWGTFVRELPAPVELPAALPLGTDPMGGAMWPGLLLEGAGLGGGAGGPDSPAGGPDRTGSSGFSSCLAPAALSANCTSGASSLSAAAMVCDSSAPAGRAGAAGEISVASSTGTRPSRNHRPAMHAEFPQPNSPRRSARAFPRRPLDQRLAQGPIHLIAAPATGSIAAL